MSEMVERVARAIQAQDTGLPVSPFTPLNGDCVLAARAAIEAMRNPPPAVIEAVTQAICEEFGVPSDWPGVEDLARPWNAGIDAALVPVQTEAEG